MFSVLADNAMVKVKAVFEVKGTAWSISLINRCSDNLYASLLADRINEAMRNKLEKIRQDAYEQGWEDHKKRRQKTNYHFGNW